MLEPEKVLDPILLGVRSHGDPLFAADLSVPTSEEDALALLNLNTDLARFIPLRQFDGLLSSEERSLLFYSRAMTHWHAGAKILSTMWASNSPGRGGTYHGMHKSGVCNEAFSAH